MAWLDSLLYLAILSMVEGMPKWYYSGITLPESDLRLRNSTSRHAQGNSQNRTHPPFMMQLYQILAMGNKTMLSMLKDSILLDSDAVLSFTTKRCNEMDNHRALYFDMSSLSNINEVHLAELRIHLPPSEKYQNVTLQIYHSTEGHKQVLLGSLNTSSSDELVGSWKVFNLTKMFSSYLNLNHTSNNDYMEYKDIPHRRRDRNCTDISTDKVILMVFTKDNPASKSNGYPNLIQTVPSSKLVIKPEQVIGNGTWRKMSRKSRNVKPSIIADSLPPRDMESVRPPCRKADMIVDFKQYGWGDRIIYPKRFNAYRCEGACPVPVSKPFQPKTNAYVRSLTKYYKLGSAECPFCVPVKMKPIIMLLYEDKKVIIRYHADMIVEECGCH